MGNWGYNLLIYKGRTSIWNWLGSHLVGDGVNLPSFVVDTRVDLIQSVRIAQAVAMDCWMAYLDAVNFRI